MMRIEFSPQRGEPVELAVEKLGDALIVNGETFDFSSIADGEEIAPAAIGSPFLPAPVRRVAGGLIVTLLAPHGARAPAETCFPAEIADAADGPIPVPPYGPLG